MNRPHPRQSLQGPRKSSTTPSPLSLPKHCQDACALIVQFRLACGLVECATSPHLHLCFMDAVLQVRRSPGSSQMSFCSFQSRQTSPHAKVFHSHAMAALPRTWASPPEDQFQGTTLFSSMKQSNKVSAAAAAAACKAATWAAMSGLSHSSRPLWRVKRLKRRNHPRKTCSASSEHAET